jgi:predicted dinucleotide-binding enzyme
VSGKTLGIIGFGSIGRAVAVRAAAFGMRIVTVARGSSGSSSSASEQQQRYNDTPFAGKQILLLSYLTTHLISIGSSAASAVLQAGCLSCTELSKLALLHTSHTPLYDTKQGLLQSLAQT